jgi:hypothetical protein
LTQETQHWVIRLVPSDIMESRSEAKVSGESKFKDKRVRLSSAAMARPQSQNPKGRRLIPVLLKQGLMLLPLSLKILGKKTASFKI